MLNNAQISSVSSVLTGSLLLTDYSKGISDTKLQNIKEQLSDLPSVLDKKTLQNLTNGEYDISLKQYTNMNTYNAVMSTVYGNNSANKFQSIIGFVTNSSEDNLATAKSFVDKMKEYGMSNNSAVKTYIGLKKYSLISSVGNYNFVNAKA